MATLVIGAAGAVGTRLVGALARQGEKIVVADRLPRIPEPLAERAVASFPSVDVRDASSIRNMFNNSPKIETVWNLAAPLSVETALDPKVAEAVTVGGMRNVLDAMSSAGVRKICFTDSIGSFGAEAPRKNCAARWLSENPNQDPGSDYGRQKGLCRELMKEFGASGGDPRFAVLPGVLHSEPVWGRGTTEYALEAMQAAALGQSFACPIEPHVVMPMIYVTDLMTGLLALQSAPEEKLSEPERGYCIPGLSFSAEELFAEIRRHKPDFDWRIKIDKNMNKFASIWPDDLCRQAPQNDLGYSPKVGLREMVAHVMIAQEERIANSRAVFRLVDEDRDGALDRDDMATFLSDLLQVPNFGPRDQERKDALCDELVQRAFDQIGVPMNGRISYPLFHEWAKRDSVFRFAQRFMDEKGAHKMSSLDLPP